MTRSYDMTTRGRAAANTTERIAGVTEALLRDGPVGHVTLAAIADGAQVTVQTVLRHMGSREGCFAAVRERVRARIEADRGHVLPGDVAQALAGLMAHYERDGRLVLNLVAQESADLLLQAAVAEGRAYHRDWVQRAFGTLIICADRDEQLDALVTATDLSAWKLLRIDLGRSERATAAVLHRLVRAVLDLR